MATSTQWQLTREAATRYEQIIVPAFIGPFAQVLVEWAELPAGASVLDVGCGTGAATRLAAERVGPSGSVTGVDVNAGMIEEAKSLPAVQGAAIEWHEQSAYQLPLPDQSVDIVLCAQVLQFLQDKPQALAEMVRVLKPGGRVAVSTWCDLEENPYFLAQVEAITTHIGPGVAAGLRAGFSLPDASKIRDLLQAAGFSIIEITVQQIDLSLPSMKEFVPRYISATPMAAAFNAASPATQQSLVADSCSRLARYEIADGARIPFRSHLARARIN
jgi:ubiquinone/menaquinone biosynthesis C-methylase UbiE